LYNYKYFLKGEKLGQIETLNEKYSTTRLCYKLLDDDFLDEKGKIKE